MTPNRAYGLGVFVCLMTFMVGMALLDRVEMNRDRDYRVARELDNISLAARSVSDRLSIALAHFYTVSRQTSSWSKDDKDMMENLDCLAAAEAQSFPSLLDVSWISHDGKTQFHTSKNRVVFQKALSWGQIYMSRHVDGWRDGWVAPFSVGPGLRSMGLVYPLWLERSLMGCLVVTLDMDLFLGPIFHYLCRSGNGYVLDGLGQVVFHGNLGLVGKNIFGDVQGAFPEIGFSAQEMINVSSGKNQDGSMVWHSARIQARKLILVSGFPGGMENGLKIPRLFLGGLSGLGLTGLSLVFLASQRRALRQIGKAEKRYMAVVEAQTELVIRFRQDWTITFVNGAYCRFLSISREDLIGTSLDDYLSSQDRIGLRAVTEPQAWGREEKREWTQCIDRDGAEQWIRWNCTLVSGEWQGDHEIQGVGRDITSMMNLQREITRRKDAIDAILDSVPVPIYLVSRDGGMEMVNRAGDIFEDMSNPYSEGQRRLKYLAISAMEQGYGFYGQEISFEGDDGGERILSFNVVPYGGSSGVVKGALAAGVDVTLQREVSRQILKERENRYRRILDAIGDAVLLCHRQDDGHYAIDLANPVAEAMAAQRASLLGSPLSRIFGPSSLKKIEASISDRRGPIGMTAGLRRSWGDVIPVEMSLMFFEEERPMVLIVMRDISERIQARSRERAYARQLRNLISRLDGLEQENRRHMAAYLHDVVGQNLASVKIQLGMAKRSISGEVSVSLEHALSVVDQVISETRAMTFEIASPLLDELGFDPALERLVDKLKEDHSLKVDILSDGSADLLDRSARDLLYRSIRELLINVVKHAEVENAEVSIEKQGGFVEATVRDRGKGYSPGEADNSNTDFSFGLFGLRERLSVIQGELVCRSAPGEGTEATVRLRLREEGLHEHKGSGCR